MAQMGKHVILADVDLGTASLLPMLGIMHPKPGAASVAGQECPAQGRRRNLRTRKSA
jgi:MinD-like ATPase involved in chromosome partitioning or flagellar assembly